MSNDQRSRPNFSSVSNDMRDEREIERRSYIADAMEIDAMALGAAHTASVKAGVAAYHISKATDAPDDTLVILHAVIENLRRSNMHLEERQLIVEKLGDVVRCLDEALCDAAAESEAA